LVSFFYLYTDLSLVNKTGERLGRIALLEHLYIITDTFNEQDMADFIALILDVSEFFVVYIKPKSYTKKWDVLLDMVRGMNLDQIDHVHIDFVHGPKEAFKSIEIQYEREAKKAFVSVGDNDAYTLLLERMRADLFSMLK
jgi:hypothetical protein